MAPAKGKKTLYEILGVPRDANDIDIGLAYEKRTQEMQRAVPHDPNAEALLANAYEVLNNPARRAAYDASLVTAAERAAASEQASAPDLVLDGGEEAAARKIPWAAIVAGGIVVIVVLYFALRPSRLPDPEATRAAEAAAEAPKPAAPAPPRMLPPAEILKLATTSGGQLVSVEMSGTATPIGIAVAVEPRTMVTTCHGIQAGRKLVVMVGKETVAADPAITDETLDLCRLSVPGLESAPFTLAPEDAKAGEKIYVMGVNSAGVFAMTEGTVRSIAKTPNGPVLDLSVPIAATGSGGGVFDAQGRLVGIAVTPHKYGPNLNVAVPVSWLAQIRSRGRTQ